jgi:alpha-beta hydrolase superfamily lysophospholipase
MKKFIDTRHGRIWSRLYSADGAKAVVVSYGGSGEYRTVDTWADERLANWLNTNSFSMLSFDKWGCGESEGTWRTVSLDILMETALDVVEQVRNSQPLPVIYLGQSEGSKLGFEIASKTSACCGYVLRVPSHQDIESRLEYQILEMHKDKPAWETWRSGIKRLKEDLAKGRKTEGFLYNFPYTFWASALGRKQPGDLIPGIHLPLFVLNGDSDPFTPRSAFQAIHTAMQSHSNRLSQAKVYPNVGHGLKDEKQDWPAADAAKDIIGWLDLVCEK